jgi:hypothetical protein
MFGVGEGGKMGSHGCGWGNHGCSVVTSNMVTVGGIGRVVGHHVSNGFL